MADIELVIKIPEEDYLTYSELSEKEMVNELSYHERIIANGTSLPKGHGGLIDVGQCDRKLFYQQCGGADSLITAKSAFDMLMLLPTIIEADESEDKE